MIDRAVDKGRQVVSFFRKTGTPLPLSLDIFRLKRSPFVAVSGDRLKLKIQPGHGESFTFYENLVRKDYLRHGVALAPGQTVVDIGANVGAFSVLAASIVGPGGRVVALEPVPETFERLRENVALNGLNQVECLRAAIDAREGTVVMRTSEKSAYATAHHVNEIGDDGPGHEVPCRTLGRILDDLGVERVHLLKVDCEGSEYGIFETMTNDVAARIDQIVMEVHPVAGRSSDDLGRRLGELGFEVRYHFPWVAFKATAGTAPVP